MRLVRAHELDGLLRRLRADVALHPVLRRQQRAEAPVDYLLLVRDEDPQPHGRLRAALLPPLRPSLDE